MNLELPHPFSGSRRCASASSDLRSSCALITEGVDRPSTRLRTLAFWSRESGVRDNDGRVLGHLAFLSTRPRGEELMVRSVYRIFLARAAADIERLQALARPQA